MSLVNSPFFMASTGAGFAEGSSLRFEDGDSPYMEKSVDADGDIKKWTLSFWVKRCNLGQQYLFSQTNEDGSGANIKYFFCRFNSDDKLMFADRWGSSPGDESITTTAVFRDPSAWYHIVLVRDSDNATQADRAIIYVNGVRQTVTGSFTQSKETEWNRETVVSYGAEQIGRFRFAGTWYYGADFYLANVCNIDGTVLTPTSFGEYEDTLWKPKSDADIQALTFGTNGFYLPMKQTTEAEGFSTVTYTGTSAEHHVEGVGFEPDFVWIKSRTSAESHWLYDSVRGVDKGLKSNTTDSEYSNLGGLEAFESSGFELGTYDGVNDAGNNYVAWCWDAGTGSAASNTDGSITSSVKANTTKGFSIATYTGNGSSGATFGHGLGVAPDMVIVKRRDGTNSWQVYTSMLGATKFLELMSSYQEQTATNRWNDTAPSSSVVTLGNSSNVNSNGGTCVAYSFASVSGYSDFGSYSGTGAAGNSITGLGFKPAFVMIKRTDAADNWVMFDNTRDPVNSAEKYLLADLSQAEATFSTVKVDFDSDGFTLQGSANSINNSSGTYIYMAFKDTRDATFFGDTSGNSNNWTPNALNNTDVMPDSTVTNFATFNPTIPTPGGTLSEGNLKFNGVSTWGGSKSSIGVPSSGKWYAEARVMITSSNTYQFSFGIKPYTTLSGYTLTKDYSWFFNNGFFIMTNGAFSTNGGFTTPAGTIVQVAIDADNGKVWLGYNNSWYDTYNTTNGNPSAGTNETFSGLDFEADDFAIHTDCVYNACFANFGQDSSFAGNETPQGNTDDNGQGDFYYAPPSGFLALNRNNLSTPDILDPADYFNTVLYTGNGSTQSITSVGFQSDWVWIKERPVSSTQALYDSVRGNTKVLSSDRTYAEIDQSADPALESFDTNGFTVDYPNSSDFYVNRNGQSYVAWNWLADNTSGSSNTDGSITSTVAVNQDAGFSIVSWNASSTSATIGHGLGAAPEMVIQKTRDSSINWVVQHIGLANMTTKHLYLNGTNSVITGTAWSAPTSTTFGTSSSTVKSGDDYIAYCFTGIEGYSKFGSYTGNGSTDGPFVHCGFRPAFVMVKITDTAGSWILFDNKRSASGSNAVGYSLLPNAANAEDTSAGNVVDFLSNGFKVRSSGSFWDTNKSGSPIIFMAFAEAPFKNANAR